MLKLIHLVFLGLIASAVAFPGTAAAEQTKKITWENLLPGLTPLQNPLDALPNELWDAYNDINYWKRLQEGPQDESTRAELKEVEKKAQKAFGLFKAKGMDAKELFKQQENYLDEIEKRGKIVAREYDGQQVNISGYLLPLDLSEQGAKEFLLVPYVGACIHVPPPPPNQMIYVKAETVYQSKDLFEPVTISGTLKIEALSKKLSLVDGSEIVESGYKIQSGQIQPYVETEKNNK